MLGRYRSILLQPGAPRLVLTALLARLSPAMNALAVVLLVHRATHSIADAGVVDAGLALGAATISPGQGRLVDRLGQLRVLIPSAFVSSAALVGLDLAVHQHLSLALLTVIAAIGGGALPPLSASMRALWASLIPEPTRLATAFALEAALSEVYFITGPLLTALIVALATPSAAVITSATLSLLATIAFATSQASRRWRAPPAGKRTLAGPLAGPGIRTLVVSIIPMGLAFGTFEVAMPAFAAHHGHPAAAGLLLGAMAAGSLVGGLLYGSRTWPGSTIQRYLLLSGLFAAGTAPLLLGGTIPAMVILMALAGFTIAPVTACIFGLIEDVAPPGTTTEAFTWIFTANMSGSAAGAAAAGAIIHTSGIRAALLLPICGVAASFCLTLARRRTLTPLSRDASGQAAAAGT